MALVQNAFNCTRVFAQIGLRAFSTSTPKIKKTVLISQSPDVFTNLALEEWLYQNMDFTNQHILMLWQNNPCVIIGRHQNPWLESNVSNLPFVTDAGVALARRSSGGATSYQDQGTLNMTFFTPNHCVNKIYNAELISRAVFRQYGLKLDMSSNQNLQLRSSKVSNNAARVGDTNAYHQYSLSVNKDKVHVNQALQTPDNGIESNAPKSYRSKIMNLCEEIPEASVKGLLSAIGWEYLRTKVNSLKDGGMMLASCQNGFQLVNPTEQWFPGLKEIRESLSSWNWCYGKTPKFTVTKPFPIPCQLATTFDCISGDLSIRMVVEQGRVTDVSLYVPQGLSSTGFSGEAEIITSLKNLKFTDDAIHSFEWSLHESDCSLNDDRDKIISECVRQVMTSV